MQFIFPLTARPVAWLEGGKIDYKASDYDFLQDQHTVTHKKLKERLCGCTEWIDIAGVKATEKILDGLGNIEKHFLKVPGIKPVQAIALRLFDPYTRLWSLYWVDSVAGRLDPPLQDAFENDLGVFFGKDFFEDREILVQFQYDRTRPFEPVWRQAFSADEGITWEWNWFMFYKK